MENTTSPKSALISQAFKQYHQMIIGYINRRINNIDDAEDMSQDVFLRLMEYKDILCEETIKNFIFTIAQNRVIDYIRRINKKIEIYSYIYDFQPSVTTYTPEQEASAHDLLMIENHCMRKLPPQRCKIYYMSRIEEKSTDEIAKELHLSRRTVESHQFMARKEVRENLRRII